jgi:very-short-patch-repair endonuclease
MLRYEQRFNVAVSRGRDRIVLVRSVQREELNPNDLKARLIAHFENPMPDVEISQDAYAMCDFDFEKDVLSQLLKRGYNVRSQVGSLGDRIDMVVEGANGRRLAVECDGDRYHGPEQWRQDMRRQRVLERVGWRFWRSFASSYYRDPDAVINDLVSMLTRLGIEPAAKAEGSAHSHPYTEHRVAQMPVSQEQALLDAEGVAYIEDELPGEEPATIQLSDKVVLFFADTNKRISVRVFDDDEDLDKGRLSIHSRLGTAVCAGDVGDEIVFRDGDTSRTVLIESVEKVLTLQAAAEIGGAVAGTPISAAAAG